MKESNTNQRSLFMGVLCAILVVMGIAYGTFATDLNVKGTSNVASNWNVKITNIESQNIIGNVANVSNPTHTDLTATFNTKLSNPGDSIEYHIMIENQGDLDATLERISLSDPYNPAIKFTPLGITEGADLTAGESATLIIKVEYLANVTTQPDNTTANLTAVLNFVQSAKTKTKNNN